VIIIPFRDALGAAREKDVATQKQLDKSEDHLKALQSIGQVCRLMSLMCRHFLTTFFQLVAEVLRELSEEKCM
jgi:hypothetical protein